MWLNFIWSLLRDLMFVIKLLKYKIQIDCIFLSLLKIWTLLSSLLQFQINFSLLCVQNVTWSYNIQFDCVIKLWLGGYYVFEVWFGGYFVC